MPKYALNSLKSNYIYKCKYLGEEESHEEEDVDHEEEGDGDHEVSVEAGDRCLVVGAVELLEFCFHLGLADGEGGRWGGEVFLFVDGEVFSGGALSHIIT